MAVKNYINNELKTTFYDKIIGSCFFIMSCPSRLYLGRGRSFVI